MSKSGIYADCIITDPPYMINYSSRRSKDMDYRFKNTIRNDNNRELIEQVMPLLNRILKKDGAIYMFCNDRNIDYFKREVEKYFRFKNLIVWDKAAHTAGDLKAQYAKRYEFIIYANKGRAKFNAGMKRYEDIWQFKRVAGKSQIHQNQKPVELIERMIAQHTKKGELVLDAFSGSGTTAVAAIKTGRQFIGFEMDKNYFEAGEKRIQEKTKKEKEI